MRTKVHNLTQINIKARLFNVFLGLQKESAPVIEAVQTLFSVLLDAFPCLFHTLFTVQMGFGEEFVGKTDELLFQADRHKFPVRYRKPLTDDAL